MERNDILVWNIVERRVHFCFECRELFDVCCSILLISICVCRIGFLQLIGNIAHLHNSLRNAQPDMRVISLFVVDEFDSARGINDLQLLLLFGHLVHEVLHTRTVDDKGIRLFQRLHILCHQLIVVQTACLGLCHIVNLYTVNAIRNVDGCNVHWVE